MHNQIYIEANIGTGKTTFLNWIGKKLPKIPVVLEPVDQWTALKDRNNKSILQHFYEDQSKWSFAFQMNSFITRIQKINNTPGNTKFIERSVFTDKNCFAKNCYENGKMSDIEYQIYNNWHNWLCANFNVTPKAFIYLTTTPQICLERIHKRNRNGEDSIPINYLTQLHNLHEEWMKQEIEKGVPVLILDISENFYLNKEMENQIIEKINNFLETLNIQ